MELSKQKAPGADGRGLVKQRYFVIPKLEEHLK